MLDGLAVGCKHPDPVYIGIPDQIKPFFSRVHSLE